ncbi:MAG: peptidyl-tRNA hydrolase [Thermocrispum sp.]
MTGPAAVLAPLRARYASWLALPADAVVDTRDEEPAEVRAMQLVMRLERQQPAPRTAVLEAAAAASVAVCLHPRSQPGGEWHDDVAAWVSGRIRKVARRARGTHWDAVQQVAGLTAMVAGAEVRALVPGPVAAVPKLVGRLQIAGSDLPSDDPATLEPPAGRPVLWVNPEVPMTVGKAAAQVGHATMLLAAALEPARLEAWAAEGYRCAVRTPTAARWRSLLPGSDPAAAWRERRVVAVRDAGYTEIAPGTITVLAVD